MTTIEQQEKRSTRGYCVDIPLRWFKAGTRFHELGPEGVWVLLHAIAYSHEARSDGFIPTKGEKWITWTAQNRVPAATLQKLVDLGFVEMSDGRLQLIGWSAPVEEGGLEQEPAAHRQAKRDHGAAYKRWARAGKHGEAPRLQSSWRVRTRGECVDIPTAWLDGDPRIRAIGPQGLWVLLMAIARCIKAGSDGFVTIDDERWITYTDKARVPAAALKRLLTRDFAEMRPGGWQLLRWSTPVRDGGLGLETAAERQARLDGWAAQWRARNPGEDDDTFDYDTVDDTKAQVSASSAANVHEEVRGEVRREDVREVHAEVDAEVRGEDPREGRADVQKEVRAESSPREDIGEENVHVHATTAAPLSEQPDLPWPGDPTAQEVPRPRQPLDDVDALPAAVTAVLAELDATVMAS